MTRLPESFVIDALSRALDLMASDDIRDFFGEDEYPPHQFPFGLWFRGHSKPVGELIEPRVFRNSLPWPGSPGESADAEGTWDETNVYEHLRLRTPSHEATYHTAFDWLCLMQHYSLPTRLLDWSESILAALYFVVKDDKDDDGQLVVLNAKRLNFKSKIRPTISTPDDAHVVIRAEMATTRSLKTLACRKSIRKARHEDTHGKLDGNWIENCRRPIAVFPRRLNDRMVFQSSVFTLHGGKMYSEELRRQYPEHERMPPTISLDTVNDECSDKPILKRYIIPKDAKGPLLEELFRLGIHEAMLFPEVDRQAGYLQRLWWYSKES